MAKIRILIADDHQVVREGLERLLAEQPDMRVVALAADGEAAALAAREHAPHVAVVDMRMPGTGGVGAIRLLQRQCPSTRVLVLSMYEDARYTRAALDAGAHGYVSKRAGGATLLRAIRALNAGERFVDVEGPAAQPSHPEAALSVREREVLEDCVAGYTSRQTAERLGISKSSVDTYRARVFEKLEVESRVELLSRVAPQGRSSGEPS